MTYKETLFSEIESVEQEIVTAKEEKHDEDLQTLEAWRRALVWALSEYEKAVA